MSLRRYTWRAMQQRPGRTILTILSIVIGVTAAVAVGLGTAATRTAYQSMFALVTGKATLEVTAKGGGAFPESVVEDVRKVPGVKVASPVIDRGTSMSFGDGKRTRLKLLGVDPKIDPLVRDYKFVVGRNIESGDELALDEGLASNLGLKVGDKVKIIGSGVRGGSKEHTIVGLFRIESGISLAQLGMALMELEHAQSFFIRSGFEHDAIDKIQIVTEGNLDQIEKEVAAALRTVKLPLRIVRGDSTIQVVVTVENPAVDASGKDHKQSIQSVADLVGIQGSDADQGGALLTKVADQSPAKAAELEPGDVVKAVGGEKIPSYESLLEAIQTQIGVEVHRPASSTQFMRVTLMSAEQGLELATLFSLLMAAFIILNTFLMNVSERRRHISIMRAIGASRNQITFSLLAEAILLGLIGTAVGIAAGFGLAAGATQIVALAYDVQLPRIVDVMTPWPFVKGAVFGLLMALVGALVPGILAGRVSPLEGMNRLVRQPSYNFTGILLFLGAVQVVGALVVIAQCIYGHIPIDVATWCALPLLIGFVMLDAALLAPQVSAASAVLRLFCRVEASLAEKQVLRNRMRSVLTVAVLFVAGSTGVGMANSILDNVRNVHDWQRQALVADFYLRAMMPDMATGDAPDLPDEIGVELKQVLNIKISGTNLFEVKIPQPGTEPEDALTAIGISRDYSSGEVSLDLIAGDRENVGQELQRDAVVVGSVLAQKLNLTVGDKLPLETRTGIKQVPICGVTNDYLAAGMSIYISQHNAEAWLGAHGIDGYMINVEKGYMDSVKPQLLAMAKKYDVLLISQEDIAKAINRFVGGTEWSLWLLVMMGFVVAAFGMVNTLTMNVLEQTRELGLLRIVAMTKAQVRTTIMMQALIIVGIGLPPGVALGVGIAYVLNLTMMASFGHLIHFHTYPVLLIETFIGGIIIVVLSAWFPARRATRINVVEALHYE